MTWEVVVVQFGLLALLVEAALLLRPIPQTKSVRPDQGRSAKPPANGLPPIE